MEAKFVSKPAFTVSGLIYHGQPGGDEIPRLWDQFMAKMPAVKRVINPTICYGVCDHFDEETKEFDYMAACEVDPESEATEGLERWTIPAQHYAIFTTTLPKIGATFDAIYSRWLPSSGYRHADGPELELYDETFNPEDPDSELLLHIPVEKV